MTLDEYKTALSKHDWYFQMSDDGRVHRAGACSQNHLVEMARVGDGEFKRAYNEAHAKHFHKPPFAQPYTFPFKL